MMNDCFVSAKGIALGRLASKIALLLIRIIKSNTKDLQLPISIADCSQLYLSGRKEECKQYFRHSSFPGGIKSTRIKDLLKRDSRGVIMRTIKGMLPKNKLIKNALQLIKNQCNIQ